VADVHLVLDADAFGRPRGVDLREFAQRHGGGLLNQVVDRNLVGFWQHGVELRAQRHRRAHVDVHGHVEVRRVLLALGHALADRLADARKRLDCVLRAGRLVGRRGYGRRRRCRGGLVSFLHVGLDVALDDAAHRPGARNLAQVDAQLRGHPQRHGRGQHATILRRGDRFRSRFLWRCRLFRALGRLCDHFGCGLAGNAKAGQVDLFARLADHADRRADRHALARLNQDLQQHAGAERRHLDRCLVRLH